MACASPFYVQKKVPVAGDRYDAVPCGKCPNCIKRRAAQWIFRLKQQEKVSQSAHFITLTYANEFITLTQNGFPTLVKHDVQKFFKRLRINDASGRTIKYYLAAEYGSSNQRPHYHAIVFNISDSSNIQKSWPLGTVDIGSVSGASIAYTTAYINKGKAVPAHKRDDRAPEFSLMSKGLGLNYINDKTLKYHHDDKDRFYVVESGNTKISMPRYYRDKIYNDEQKKTYQRKVRPQVEQAEKERMDAYVKRTGSLKGYSRSREESKKVMFENFFRAEKNKRKL